MYKSFSSSTHSHGAITGDLRLLHALVCLRISSPLHFGEFYFRYLGVKGNIYHKAYKSIERRFYQVSCKQFNWIKDLLIKCVDFQFYFLLDKNFEILNILYCNLSKVKPIWISNFLNNKKLKKGQTAMNIKLKDKRNVS